MVTSPKSDSLVFKDAMLTKTYLTEEDDAFPVPVFTYTVNLANNDCGYNDNSRITTEFLCPEQSPI